MAHPGAVAALALAAPVWAQSGFTRDQGSLYAKLGATTFTSNDFYDLEGNLNDRGQEFTQRQLVLYAEYGVIAHLTALVDVPLVRVNSYAETDATIGFGDARVGLKYGVEVTTLHIAASVMPELPTGDSEATVKTDTGARLILPTGDGELNVWNHLAVSRPFSALDAYASAYGGYNARTQGFSDQLGYGAEFGYHLLGAVWLQARVRGQSVPGRGDPASGGFIFGEGTEYLSAGFGVAAALPFLREVQLIADAERAVARRRNLYSGTVWGLGVALEHDFIE